MPRLNVDEDGFVAVVAPDSYRGFVGEDWTMETLLERLTAQMNDQTLFIAYAGPDDANEEVAFAAGPTPFPAGVRRETSGVVAVGPGGLWVTDYTQLTMAAQSDEEGPIANHSSTRLPVSQGRCRVTLRQFAEQPQFELTVTDAPETDRPPQHTSVPWLE